MCTGLIPRTFFLLMTWSVFLPTAFAQEMPSSPETTVQPWVKRIFNDTLLCGQETPELRDLLLSLQQISSKTPTPEAVTALVETLIRFTETKLIPLSGGCHYGETFLKPAVDPFKLFDLIKSTSQAMRLVPKLVANVSEKEKNAHAAGDWNYALAESLLFTGEIALNSMRKSHKSYESYYSVYKGEEHDPAYKSVQRHLGVSKTPRFTVLEVDCKDVLGSEDSLVFSTTKGSLSPSPERQRHLLLLVKLGTQMAYEISEDEQAVRGRLKETAEMLAKPHVRDWLGDALHSESVNLANRLEKDEIINWLDTYSETHPKVQPHIHQAIELEAAYRQKLFQVFAIESRLNNMECSPFKGEVIK